MRLTCPNCGAQYEVDAAMIPPEGRDVQCSNCAQTWFQAPEGPPPSRAIPPIERAPEAETEVTETEADEVASAPETVETIEEPPATPEDAEVAESPSDEPETAEVDEPEDPTPSIDASADSDDEVAPVEESQGTADTEDEAEMPRKPSDQLEESLLGILREEAEREVQARRDDAAALETQTEMGLESLPDEPVSLSDNEDDLDARAEEDEEILAGSRSDLLPDIDEINSSLRPAEQHEEVQEIQDPVVVETKQKRGFRLGFSLVLILVAILVFVYAFAPTIAARVPASEPYLILYVEKANLARDGVDGLIARITSITGSDGGQ